MGEVKPDVETSAKIKVVGVGGSGANSVTRMMECKLKSIDFVAVNTDAQDLHHCKAQEKIHIGKNLTRGLGAGMNPEIGRQAAEENRDEIQEALKGMDMVFVVYGAGGGTGSGAGPVIAEAAREAGALTIGLVTKPFSFEGRQRTIIAEESIENLKDRVDTLIVIQNDKLLQIIDRNTSLVNAFKIVDDVLRQGVQGISDLITKPGIVNVDFADVRAVMQDSGSALMGIGVASGEDRAIQAAKSSINSPLLDVSIDGAGGVLFNITGGEELTMMEVDEAARVITENIDPNARIIFGASIDDSVKKGEVRITVVATGFDLEERNQSSDVFPKTKQTNFVKTEVDKIVNKSVNKNKKADAINIFAEEDDEEKLGGIIKRKRSLIKNEEAKDTDSDLSGSQKSMNLNNDFEEEELEIPAFIRKKLGK